MPVFADASREEIRHLLQLFPITYLKASWPEFRGTKDQIATQVAGSADRQAIANFVVDNFTCCKQHVRVFTLGQGQLTFPVGLAGGEQIHQAADTQAMYMVRVNHKVILSDPLEHAHMNFLWPILIQRLGDNLVLRSVGLEKDLEAYFDRPCFVRSRDIEEDDVIEELAPLHLGVADLHAGVKSLWENGFMDAIRTTFKKPYSQASEKMDEGKGIREHYPELYETLKVSTLFSTLFIIQKTADCSVGAVTCNPSAGFLSFSSYAEKQNGTDYVVSQILQQNQPAAAQDS
ncbi:MAG: hypothetical protein M3O20_05540 [Acidobacteriota bacterium]|nr:hypothetical protein [Acidobacteriota bacterium]